MFAGVFKIAVLCVFIGGASIPVSFTINSSPVIVWIGNAIGSLFSAAVVIFIGDRITSVKFKEKISKRRIGEKVVEAFDEGDGNKKVQKARNMINKRGLKLFSLFCPIFPGVLISTSVIYALDLDKKTYKRWMFAGVIFVSGAYVFSYWWVFVKPH